MFDVPLDAWYAWFGLAAASVAILGVATSLPTAAPPDARAVARTVDGVAASPHLAVAEQPLTADEIRLSGGGVALRSGGDTVRAEFTYGPVAPVTGRGPLSRVLRGEPPDRVFDSPARFAAAVETARRRPAEWSTAPNQVTVRRVRWGGVDVTLVG